MQISDLLDPSRVAVRSGASSPRQVLVHLADLVAAGLHLAPEGVLDALLAREALGSTGLGDGVAVPHARLAGLQRVTGALIRLETPAPFEALDGRPVDLVFGLFSPLDAGAEHLRALAAASRLLRRSEVRARLRAARTAESLYALAAQPAEAHAA